MKGLIKIILGLVVILVIASPYVAGRMIERDYNKIIARLNVLGKGNVKVVGTFDRGFFSSTAVTNIAVANAPISLHLTHAIKHGPVIFKGIMPQGINLGVITTTFGGEFEKMITDAYAGKPAYDITSKVSLHGNVNTVINNYPLNLTLPTGSMSWQGFTALIKTDKELAQISGNISIPSIDYTEALTPDLKQSAYFKNIKIDFNDDSAANSTFNLSIDNAKIISNMSEDMKLDQFVLGVNRTIINKLMDVTFKMNFSKLFLTNLEYGPLVFSLDIKNIDLKAIQDAQLENIQQPAGMQQVSGELIPKLLANKISLDLNLSLKTPDGDIAVTSNFVMASAANSGDSKQVTAGWNGKQNIQVSKKLAYKILVKAAESKIRNLEIMYYMNNPTSKVKNPYTMTPQQLLTVVSDWVTKVIAQLTAQKYVLEQNDTFVTDISIVNGVITVNGIVKAEDDFNKLQSLLEIVPPPAEPITVPGTPPVLEATPTVVNPPTTTTQTVPTQSVPASPAVPMPDVKNP